MNEFDPPAYGPVFEPLVDVDRCRPLDAGTPNTSEQAILKRLAIKSAFAPATRAVADRNMAECCLSGVWLVHDFLDESHAISQGIHTTSGSFWHAIMHRREGDFSNAKYWFRRVGNHPVFEPLAQRAAALGVLIHGSWDPYAFVDLCQTAVRSGKDLQLCLDVQQAEWELLFDYCYHAALRG
jgi:hypothetical protein